MTLITATIRGNQIHKPKEMSLTTDCLAGSHITLSHIPPQRISMHQKHKKYVGVPGSLVSLGTHSPYANDINATSRNNARSPFLWPPFLMNPFPWVGEGWTEGPGDIPTLATLPCKCDR